MEQIEEIRYIAAHCSRFFLIYIKEAHAEDTWPIGVHHKTLQTTSNETRLENARTFLKRERMPEHVKVFVDDASTNAFDVLFAAWPLRFYVLDGSRVSFIAEPHGQYVDVKDLTEYLILRKMIS